MNKKLFITIVIISSIYLYSHIHDSNGKWFITEQTALNQRRQHITQTYWDAYVIQQPNHDHTLIKNILTTRSILKNIPENINEQCDEAINTKIFTSFSSLFNTIDDF